MSHVMRSQAGVGVQSTNLGASQIPCQHSLPQDSMGTSAESQRRRCACVLCPRRWKVLQISVLSEATLTEIAFPG